MSETNEGEQPPQSPPRTPDNVEKIPKDESFKTCKSSMRKLRMTPARISMVQGQKIFKEASNSGKKFNSRSKKRNESKNNDINDTAGSNETFIRCEQEIMFDRDSLEPENIHKVTRKQPVEIINHNNNVNKEIDPPETKPRSSSVNNNKRQNVADNFKQPAMVLKKEPASVSRKQPASSYKKPNLQSTASKYLDTLKWNNSRMNASKWTASKWNSTRLNSSRLVRSSSYKSTAEIERDYIRSLRSF